MKSLRNSGTSTAARTARRSSSEPLKWTSVRTEIAAAPPATYSRATLAGSSPGMMSPLLGDARLISAIIAGRRARNAATKSRALGRAPRFGDNRHRRHDCASSAHFDAFGGVNIVEDRGHLWTSFGISPLLARRILSRTSRARLEAIISRAASTPSFSDAALPPT